MVGFIELASEERGICVQFLRAVQSVSIDGSVLTAPANEVACRSILHGGGHATGSDTVERGLGPTLPPVVRPGARPVPVETSAVPRGSA